MGAVYKRCDDIDGIRFWRVDFPLLVPRYDVFRVIAHDVDTGTYWFRSIRDGKTTIARSHYQLNANGFYPFVIPGTKATGLKGA